MKHVLLALMQLFGVTGVVAAGDYQDGRDALARGDYAIAFAKFMKAAEAGDTGAQLNLGWMYEVGLGVPQDHVQAHRWSNIAVANTTNIEDRDRAVRDRDRIAQKMSTHQIAEAQKLAREWKPTTGTAPDR